MKNVLKSRFSTMLGIAVALTVIVFLLSGCMSTMMKMGTSLAQKQNKDYGVFDSSVTADQQAELRFMFVNIKSFNGTTVSWGDKANNQGFVKVPAGNNTIIFDWVQETTQMTGVDYNSARGSTTYKYTTTTSSLDNIIFPDVEMLPGHNYFIGGGKGNDGQLRIWLLDQTYTPMGFYGDTVADPPKASKTATEFEGSWKNIFDESFEFTGNTWIHTMPPLTGANTGPNEIRLRGTFEIADEYITMYVVDTSIDKGRWFPLSSMRQANIWKYSFNENELLMEVPYFYPELAYTKQ